MERKRKLIMYDKMNFITYDFRYSVFDGASLQGYVRASYDELVDIFGEPNMSRDPKVQCEWYIEFDDMVVATIYSWKADNFRETKKWNVGGQKFKAYERIVKLIFEYQSKKNKRSKNESRI